MKKIFALTSLVFLATAASALSGQECTPRAGFGVPFAVVPDVATSLKLIDVKQTAAPLEKFFAELSSKERDLISRTYDFETDPEALKLQLEPRFAPIAKDASGVECDPGDEQVAGAPVPQCKRGDGRLYYGKERRMFLSAATAGLHPHLYASSCFRQGADDYCLTVDLLNYKNGRDELAKAKLAQEKRIRAAAPNPACVTPAQLNAENLDPKALEKLRQYAHEGAHAFSSEQQPAR